MSGRSPMFFSASSASSLQLIAGFATFGGEAGGSLGAVHLRWKDSMGILLAISQRYNGDMFCDIIIHWGHVPTGYHILLGCH